MKKDERIINIFVRWFLFAGIWAVAFTFLDLSLLFLPDILDKVNLQLLTHPGSAFVSVIPTITLGVILVVWLHLMLKGISFLSSSDEELGLSNSRVVRRVVIK